MVITTAQLHSTSKPELRFCAGSNPAHGMSEIRDGEDLQQWSRLEIRLGLSSVNHTTKTIHDQFRSPNDAWEDYLNTWGIEPPAARDNVLMHIELWPTAIKLNRL